MCEDDQRYKQIIWRDTPDKPLQTYNFVIITVIYRTKSEPFQSKAVSDKSFNFIKVPEILEEAFYIEDLVHGSHSIEKGKQHTADLLNLLKSEGFTLRKW